MNSIPHFPDSLINGYLADIETDQVELWQIHEHAKDDFEIKDPTIIRLVALNAVQRLISHNNVITLKEDFHKGTEVWDLKPEDVIHILEKNWDAYSDFPHTNIVFFERSDMHRLEEFFTKPITYLNKPPAVLFKK